MHWFLLIIAGILEIVWAVSLKYSDGFTKLTPTIITIVFSVLSFWILSMAMRTIPLGTAYAVWTGIGIVGTIIIGMIWLNDPITFWRILFLSLIFIGVIGLKWVH